MLDLTIPFYKINRIMLQKLLLERTQAVLSRLPNKTPAKGDRVVILGCGWAGFQLVRKGRIWLGSLILLPLFSRTTSYATYSVVAFICRPSIYRTAFQ